MGLPNSRRHILAAIEGELQADSDLAASFSAFTSVTRGTTMPTVEQLRLRRWLASWRSMWRIGAPALTNGQVVFVMAVIVALAVGLTVALAAALPGGHQDRCEPAYASARTCERYLRFRLPWPTEPGDELVRGGSARAVRLADYLCPVVHDGRPCPDSLP